jgi:hypothetical protein
VLAPGDEARDYERLWTGVFAGGVRPGRVRGRIARRAFAAASRQQIAVALSYRGAPQSAAIRLAAAFARPRLAHRGSIVVAKSVTAGMAVEWIADRFNPHVVVVTRDPRSVIASRIQLGWNDLVDEMLRNPAVRHRYVEPWGLTIPAAGASPAARWAWQVGLGRAALLDAARRHPEWTLVSHEALCADPIGTFRTIAERAGLTCGDRMTDYLETSNSPGVGFDLHRVAADLPDAWRDKLRPDDVREISDVLEQFPDEPASSLRER